MNKRLILSIALGMILGLSTSVIAQSNLTTDDATRPGFEAEEFKNEATTVLDPAYILTPEEYARQANMSMEIFHETVRRKNIEFYDSLEDMPVEARQKAVNEHMQNILNDKIAFREELHANYMAYLQEELRNDPDISEGERQDIINFFEKQNEENIAFLRKQYRQNTDFYDDIDDESRPVNEQKNAIEEFLAAQREQDADHFAHQQKQNMDKLGAHRDEVEERHQTY